MAQDKYLVLKDFQAQQFRKPAYGRQAAPKTRNFKKGDKFEASVETIPYDTIDGIGKKTGSATAQVITVDGVKYRMPAVGSIEKQSSKDAPTATATVNDLKKAGKQTINKVIWLPYLGTGAGMIAGAIVANKRGSGSLGYLLWSTLFAGIGMAAGVKLVGSSIKNMGDVVSKIGGGSGAASSDDALVEKFIAIGKKNGKDLSGNRAEMKKMLASFTPKEREMMLGMAAVLGAVPEKPSEAELKKMQEGLDALYVKYGHEPFQAFMAKLNAIG